jgi:YVTN family beta-propeller protein
MHPKVTNVPKEISLLRSWFSFCLGIYKDLPPLDPFSANFSSTFPPSPASLYLSGTVSSTTINVGEFPQSLVFTADGNHAYEVNDPASSVTVIDTTTQSISGTLATAQLHAGGLALLPSGTKLFVTGDSTFVQVVYTSGIGKKKITLPESNGFNTPALTPNGLYLYLPIFTGGSTTVLMIDTKTNLVTGKPITVGTQPYAIAISSNARRAYVSNYADGTVSVINIAP